MALKLQIPVVKERIHHPRSKITYVYDKEVRNLTQIPTQVFAQKVLSADVITRDFFYIASLMESWIYLKTNIKLISNGHLPLIGDEKISLVLTGSTVVDYLAKTQASKSFKETYDEFFKEDELTYRLNLKTNESNRYEILSAYAIESATEFLQLVANGLEAIYLQGTNSGFMSTIFASNATKSNLDLNVDYNNQLLSDIKKTMAKPGFNYVNDILSTRSAKTVLAKGEAFRNTNATLAGNIGTLTTNLAKNPVTLMLSPYIYYFSNSVTKIEASSIKTCDDFISDIKSKLNAVLLNLSQNEIYAGNNKVNFNRGVVDQIAAFASGKTFNVKVGEADSEQPVYSTLKLPSDYNFVSVETLNQYVYTDAETFDKNKTTFGTQPKHHYVIVDQTNAEVTRSGKFQRDSDYVELVLSNILNGTLVGFNKEFRGLDMSIKLISIEVPRYSATDYGIVMNSQIIATPISSWQNSNLSDADKLMTGSILKTDSKLSMEYLLAKQIFDSDHYLPWINMAGDSKCKSSSANCTLATPLVQMLFLIDKSQISENASEHKPYERVSENASEHKSQINNLREVLANPGTKPFAYKLHLSQDFFDQNPTMSFYDLVTIDPTYLEKNPHIALPVKFVTIMDATGGKISPELLQKFQISYNWLANDLDPETIPKTYAEFRSNLKQVVDSLSS
jgi:hypothetical protein